MKKYLLILAAILLLWGCIAEDRTECTNPRGVFVSLTVRPERMSSVTRSADETAIRDLNLYLYDDNGNVVLHRYQTSATLRFECLPGDYRMCIAANLGRDLGDNPLWEDFTVTHADKYDVLPMAYEGDITIIPSADGMLTLLAVEVQRCVSKISYNITVTPAVADIELRSVQLFSVPRSVSVFDMAAAPSDDPDDYTDCPEVELSGQQAAGDCYLLPNMQGMVAAITDQRQKNPENAPANASYLLIRAVRGSKILAYYFTSEETTPRISMSGPTRITGSISRSWATARSIPALAAMPSMCMTPTKKTRSADIAPTIRFRCSLWRSTGVPHP